MVVFVAIAREAARHEAQEEHLLVLVAHLSCVGQPRCAALSDTESEENGGLEMHVEACGSRRRRAGCVEYSRRTSPPTEASAPPGWRVVGPAEFGANRETTR